ncbi:phytoene desaturase family protein [Echinicola jeungdonensis]|uniref:Phytoene desaturase family protein n=1 Tax=Echinicola jeungdonensis TaxID=709343 RepID=A0ABV5J6P8_9BACT|nr:phytoene desaturase family protein [Echinicola jeungdonensis]MDN3669238.1 phytoene desaturase family protein [Echinicola jeungdonensis]
MINAVGQGKKVIVIGSGFAGLSAATKLAQQGFEVKLVEQLDQPGGRARKFSEEGFVFDMGPSWYWMPDVFESYFAQFGKNVSDYYKLIRLDPSYQVIYGENDFMEVPASMGQLENLFESLEKGSAVNLRKFLDQAAHKYRVGIQDWVYKPGNSIWEFAKPGILTEMIKLDLFHSMSHHVRKYFQHEKIIRMMEFPVLFLGQTAERIPALYSLMNYADLALGTWYPMGGMHRIIEGMVQLAKEKGVKLICNAKVSHIDIDNGQAKGVQLKDGRYFPADVIIAGADYHHVDASLLPKAYRNYPESYWEKKTLAPSSLIFYLGVNKKLKNLHHHNLFFDKPLEPHAHAIYSQAKWPKDPLFYVCCPSKTDPTVAPEGMENLFVLIPLAPGLEDKEEQREKYYQKVMARLEKLTGQSIQDHVIYKKSYAHRDFITDYNAYKGNAYGLANTLGQTALLKPKLKNKKLSNFYYTGQLTVPGPGVPPSLISGQVAANEVIKNHSPIVKDKNYGRHKIIQ